MLDAPAAPTSRWLLVLAHVRQWVAVAFLGWGAIAEWRAHIDIEKLFAHPETLRDQDPAVLLYLVGAIGLAVRAFWARYWAICILYALLTVHLFWGEVLTQATAFHVGFILLLSGHSMKSLFEQRESTLNRWGTEVDARIHRLRGLFIAQSIALALIWAPGSTLSPIARPLIVVAGLALAGLVFQRTWGALLLLPVLAVEAYLATLTFGQRVHWGDPPAWAFPATLLAGVVVSLAVLTPFLRGIVRTLATERPRAV
jgi:hypothetical protein